MRNSIRALKSLTKSAVWCLTKQTATYDGVQLPIGNHMSVNMQHILMGGHYERFELDELKKCLDADDVVMELGTGIGLLSTFCAKKIGSERVHTFEANPNLQPHIEKIYELNGVKPSLNMCMLLDKIGTHTFYVAEDFWASSSEKQTNSVQITVPTKCFNEEKNRIKPTMLIIDIEGGEYELLKYADLNGVRKLIIELHPDVLGPDRVNEMIKLLAEQKFEMISSDGRDRTFLFERALVIA